MAGQGYWDWDVPGSTFPLGGIYTNFSKNELLQKVLQKTLPDVEFVEMFWIR